VFVSAVLRADASASSIQWAVKEQFSSSECTMNNLTEHTVLGRIGTVAMGLGCGGANGAAGKNYVVEGTELMEYTHYNVSAECSDTANANTTTTLDQCVESSTGVYEKVKLVTAPGTLTIIYDVGDENCSGAPISTSLSPMLCVASNAVAGFLSRLPSCYGEKQLQCYYSNSDCTGSQMCSPSSDLKSCSASGGGRYTMTSVLGSDDEVAELCTTTTTTAFAGISGNISIYTDGGCSVLDGTHSIELGPCTMTGSTSSQDFTCMEGSIAYNVYSTNDCTGEATTQVLEQGPCIPMDNGTSSWLVAFPECTGTASSSAAVHLNVGFMILSLLTCRYLC